MDKNSTEWTFHERDYRPFRWFAPYIGEGQYIRENGNGVWEYLFADESAEIFYGMKVNPFKLDESEWRKELLKNQFKWLEMLVMIGFPFQVKFLYDFSAAVFGASENHILTQIHKGSIHEVTAQRIATALFGLTIIKFFGGEFRFSKQRNLYVAVERVPVDILILKKVKTDSFNFSSWFYDLCTKLWEASEAGLPFQTGHLDFVEHRTVT